VTDKRYNEHNEVEFPDNGYATDGALQEDYPLSSNEGFEMTVVTFEGISQAETTAVVGGGGIP
jgi:hypothetical protein